MADLSEILNTLRAQQRQLETDLQKVNSAIAALEGLPEGRRTMSRDGRAAQGGPGRRKDEDAGSDVRRRAGRRKGYKLSPSTRAKMRAAWAKRKAEQTKK